MDKLLSFIGSIIIMNIIQLGVGGFDKNFSYLIIGDNKKAILIDPTGDKKIIDSTIKDNDLDVILLLITHSHPDHKELLDYFLSKQIEFKDFKELAIKPSFCVAGLNIKTILTPGHTSDSVCFLIEKNLFTGDTLFVRGLGTTAYGGNKKQLTKSIELLSTLDKQIIVWPGHDYGGSKSSLGEAISNSCVMPSKKALDAIKKRIQDYEKNF